jgi:peroxiredoxin
METDASDPVKNMVIKNSGDNQLFYDYLNYVVKIQKEIEGMQPDLAQAKTKTDSTAIQKKMGDTGKQVTDYKEKFITDYPDNLLSKVFQTSKEPEVPDAPVLENGKKDSTFAFRYYKGHYFDNVDFSDNRLLLTPLFHSKIDTYVKKLTMQMPDSLFVTADYLVEKSKANSEIFKYVVWYITNQYETSNIMGMDAVFVHMVKKYYTKDQATWIDSTQLFKIQERAKILEPILLGKKVQNLTLEDTAGTFHSLYNIKAKYTVLLFWDPDCGHCQKAVPKMKLLYDKIKPLGVEVYGIDTETEMEKYKKFIREKGLNWISVSDPHLHNNFRYEFDISTTPQIFLLDDTKTIIAKKIDVHTLQEILNRKLNTTINVAPEDKKEDKEKDEH